MELQEFNNAVGKVMGVKTGVEWCYVSKFIDTEKVIVRLQIIANESQIKKLTELIFNHKKEES